MAFYDGIKGIAGDRVFVDHFYVYKKLKLEIDTADEERNEKKKKCCEHFLSAYEHCIIRINKLRNGDIKSNYLNWIRWNHLLIFAQLAQFKEDSEFCADKKRIEVFGEKITELMKIYFKFNEADKGVSNEYAHAFDLVEKKLKNCENIHKLLIQQAARLFINYINLFIQKCYTKTFDRDNYSLETLQSEADCLSKALHESGNVKLKTDIEIVLENYIAFCDLDKNEAIAQDELIKSALKLAHKRATENVLQTALRQIRETINQIKERTKQQIKDLVTTSTVLKHVFCNPGKTFKSLMELILNPVTSAQALVRYACDHPLQFGGIVLGGILIGLFPGAIIAGGIAIADAIITTISIPVVTFAAGAVATTIYGSAVTHFAVTASEVSKIKTEEQNEIAVELGKEAILIEENLEEGNRISDDVIYDQVRRETLEKIEEEIRKKEALKKQFEAAQKEQIDSKSVEELNTAVKVLTEDAEKIQTAIEKLKEKEKAEKNRLKEMHERASKVEEGKAAAASIARDIEEKNTTNLFDSDEDV
uniref:Uncharacterized protein n=1 Tax=Panagrolaimus davidi TaxID=227884 RepID=A0A914Q5B8_9BILA